MATTAAYFVGALGNVSLTAAAGSLALERGAAKPTGMVSAAPPFADLPFVDWPDMLFGGCELAPGDPVGRTRALAQERIVPHAFAETLTDALRDYGSRIDDAAPVAEAAAAADWPLALELISANLQAFQRATGCQRLIVVHLASTEPQVVSNGAHGSPEAFAAALAERKPGLATQAMLYAWAAAEVGAAFVNFTPTPGSEIPAIAQRFEKAGLPHAGKDGKTGETLLKTVLGPLFVARNLKVMSWLANNYLGNGDGKSLDEPERRATKLGSKDQALRALLGPEPHLSTDIGYAPSLGDWKTAWDLVHFEGFLGVPMTMQLTWQGCDSALAAPLVLDLIRFVDLAWRRGESGALPWLASFFKSPQGVDEHAFAEQFRMLTQWAESARA